MCIHDIVSDGTSRESVDAQCRKMTASWVRSKHAAVGANRPNREEVGLGAHTSDVETCIYYEKYEEFGAETLMPPGKR